MKNIYNEKWLNKNTSSLSGKTVAITGSTGGLGKALCRYLAYLGASLILIDRNAARSDEVKNSLICDFPEISVKCINADLEDISSVRSACELLAEEPIDIFIHNAGAYSIPRKTCSTGYDNVFQINFVSSYYIIKKLLPVLSQRHGRVVVVGSIAHNYSKTDVTSIDFANRTKASKVYGNAKRYLMFSLYGIKDQAENTSVSVTHPGISFTGITAHYPKLIFALIKHPMKIIFMKPKKAVLSILKGVFEPCENYEWIGPRLFDVWGLPKKKKLNTASKKEIEFIQSTAERIYTELDK